MFSPSLPFECLHAIGQVGMRFYLKGKLYGCSAYKITVVDSMATAWRELRMVRITKHFGGNFGA